MGIGGCALGPNDITYVSKMQLAVLGKRPDAMPEYKTSAQH